MHTPAVVSVLGEDPAIGKGVGERVSFGGLLGEAPVMAVKDRAGTVFGRRGGRFTVPLGSLRN